ncbi:MAG: hypothetical protein MJA83_12215, partial [Gammaproteobacteria bacterium]|nr:hypothetical protein [Gammaproteobacteria bacterium]
MQSHPIEPLLGETIEACGALDFDRREKGLSPRRLPSWTRPQTPPMLDVMARMPSGVRLRFSTDSTKVALHFHATNMVTPPRERRPVSFSLECGDLLISKSSTAGNTITLNRDDPNDYHLVRGDADTVVFEKL